MCSLLWGASPSHPSPADDQEAKTFLGVFFLLLECSQSFDQRGRPPASPPAGVSSAIHRLNHSAAAFFNWDIIIHGASLVAQTVKNLPTMRET